MAKHNIKPDTIVRTICLALALINNGLAYAGKSPLPIKDEQVEIIVSQGFLVVTTLWAWWKNNSFSQAALAGDSLMRAIKKRGGLDDAEGVK